MLVCLHKTKKNKKKQLIWLKRTQFRELKLAQEKRVESANTCKVVPSESFHEGHNNSLNRTR